MLIPLALDPNLAFNFRGLTLKFIPVVGTRSMFVAWLKENGPFSEVNNFKNRYAKGDDVYFHVTVRNQILSYRFTEFVILPGAENFIEDFDNLKAHLEMRVKETKAVLEL